MRPPGSLGSARIRFLPCEVPLTVAPRGPCWGGGVSLKQDGSCWLWVSLCICCVVSLWLLKEAVENLLRADE